MIGLHKTELIKPRGPWRTAEQAEIITLHYGDWFNHRRLFETCGAAYTRSGQAPRPPGGTPHRLRNQQYGHADGRDQFGVNDDPQP